MTLLRKIRVSMGTSIQLGLRKGILPVPPTTAYLMLGENCLNNCSFCTQARSSDSRSDMLSRVSWPEFDMDRVVHSLSFSRDRGFRRVCLQCLNDPRIMKDLPPVSGMISRSSGLPVSVSIGPVSDEMYRSLKDNGVERVGIALDGASSEVFDRIKGKCVDNPYTWEGTWNALDRAVEIFGEGFVSTHIIVGMGETDKDIHETMVRCNEIGVSVSLFAYTPMKGTSFTGAPPSLGRYRALQLMRYGIMESDLPDNFDFDGRGKMKSMDADDLISGSGFRDAFRTRGCPDCNRPYYNERPGGPIYNHPDSVREDVVREGLDLAQSYLSAE